MRPTFSIAVEEVDRRFVFRLKGQLDSAHVPLLEQKIDACLKEGARSLLLDFSGVEELHAAVLRNLLAISTKLHRQNGKLLIFGGSQDVKKVIEAAGLNHILLIFETEQDALQHDGV